MLYILQAYALSLLRFLCLGVVWLFILSFPMGPDKTLFNLGYYYLVDTKPVHWAVDKIENLMSIAKDKISSMRNDVVEKVDVRLQKSTSKVQKSFENGADFQEDESDFSEDARHLE